MRISLIALCLFGTLNVFAQEAYSLKSHLFKISGTSTVHDWEVNASNITANGNFEIIDGKLKSIKSLILEIAGKDLKSSSKNKTMDEKIQESLKVAAHPKITFKLSNIVSYPNEQNSSILAAVGVITIAGTSKENSIKVKSYANEAGMIVFKGNKKILFSDYNIKPPKAMLGMMTVGNEVSIDFEIELKKN